MLKQSELGLPQSPGAGPGDGGVPAEIVDDMRILMGGLVMDSEGNIVPAAEAAADNKQQPPPNAQERWQKGMLKKHEVEMARGAFLDFQVRSFDLSCAEDAMKYEAMLNEAGSLGSDRQIEQTEPFFCADPAAPRGFRCIVMVKFFRLKKMMPPTDFPRG